MQPSPPRQTTDRLLRDTLRRPANLRDFLESALPGEVGNLDVGQARELPREFFTGDWHLREADLLFEVPYRSAGSSVPALVGILLEHLSDTDPLIPLRAFLNLAGFWERHWRAWEQQPRPKAALRLPPVFSVVLYTAEVTWGSTENIQELLAEPASFHPFAPDWGPVFWNLAGRTPEQLLDGGAWMQLMAVMRVANGDRAEVEAVFTQAMRHLAPLSDRDRVRWTELVLATLGYARFRRPPEEADTFRAITERENPNRNEEVRAMAITIAEAEERRGELRHARRILSEQLRARFGPLPDAMAQQIATCDDLGRLDTALVRFAQVKSLEEFQF
jgi:hypothetical protein